MTTFHRDFLVHLEHGAHILDSGCGSGKYAKMFLDNGFKVTAFDGSAELAQIASEKIGQPVATLLFDQFKPSTQYDAIWTNASLLHVPRSQIASLMPKFISALKQGGIWHMTFKYGEEERVKEGRTFNDYTPDTLRAFLAQFPDLAILELVKEDDLRPDREGEFWTRALVKKAAGRS